MDPFDTQYFAINKFFLSLLGLWPYQTTFTRTLRSTFSTIGIIVMCAPMLMFVFKRSDDLDSLLELMPTMVGSLTCAAKFVSLFYHFKKFETLLQQIRDDWSGITREAERIFMKYMKITRKFTSLYAFSVTLFVTCFILLPLINPLLDIVSPLNATRPKRLAHPAEFLVDQEKYYYILIVIMYYGYAVSIAIVVGIDTTYFATIEHACTLFEILSYRLENIVHGSSVGTDYDSPPKQDVVARHLVRCVRLHVKIKAFIELIETTFAVFLFFEIGLGFIMHCTLCVMIVLRMDNFTEIVVYFALVLCQSGRLFLHGWTGQQITNQSVGVYVAAYSGTWYEASYTAKKLLLMLIAKSQAICEIAVAKSFVINLESFAMIMKTSLSYCTVMISIREESSGT